MRHLSAELLIFFRQKVNGKMVSLEYNTKSENSAANVLNVHLILKFLILNN